MDKLVDKLKDVQGLCVIGACTEDEIDRAEKKLGLKFPEEYKCFLKAFGAVSFYGTEWMGLNVPDYLDVVGRTTAEREAGGGFPKDCFLLENHGINGILTICDEAGKVYYYSNGKKKPAADSLSEYVDVCIGR